MAPVHCTACAYGGYATGMEIKDAEAEYACDHKTIIINHIKPGTTLVTNTTHPLTSPDGPICVANIRLNSMGSVSSLPVSGDRILNFFSTSPISSFVMPSNWQIK